MDRWIGTPYSVDYDYLPATQLSRTMMTKHFEGLFLAGQVCGNTGCEEASAQGLIAGVNAVPFQQVRRWSRFREKPVLLAPSSRRSQHRKLARLSLLF